MRQEMYTLKDLESKPLKELKEIGYQLDRLPKGDRRCRQNWIDAIADVQPPLLQVLEVSPAAEVEVTESAIATELDSDLIESQLNKPLAQSLSEALDLSVRWYLTRVIYNYRPTKKIRLHCLYCDYSRPKDYSGAIRTLDQERVAIGLGSSSIVNLSRPPPQIS